ncbi:MAG: carbon-nitrogen hydrolase [Deltaproteobacteria bacterium]|nr:MAG: carbon-nitrogen hydrolase [Deltaproteobacteria bacterium]
MEEYLTVALVHLNVRYKHVVENRRTLLQLNKEAAQKGADIILNTELALSGYSFRSREEVSPYVETVTGESICALSKIAASFGKYIVIGFAEKDERTRIYYNTAAVLDPDGNMVCRYRKINAEARWACPGPARQNNTFNTPWGRAGILICSDTYHGLIPRSTALRGARLVLVPANWPSGGIDPRQLWRTRAMENGIYLIACNRGGIDREMKFEHAWSCAFSPDGTALMADCSASSRIHYVKFALVKGKLPDQSRKQMIEARNPHRYSPIYLDLRFAYDFTDYYGMPKPGKISVTCVASDQMDLFSPEYLQNRIVKEKKANDSFFVFPIGMKLSDSSRLKEIIGQAAIRNGIAICAGKQTENGQTTLLLATPGGDFHEYRDIAGSCNPDLMDIGPARVGICPVEELLHPEIAVAYSKLGCDLLLVPGGHIEETTRLVIGARSVEQVGVAVAGNNRAFICEPPEGHECWREESAVGHGSCTMVLDTGRTRKKRFQDRVNFELLLENNLKTG